MTPRLPFVPGLDYHPCTRFSATPVLPVTGSPRVYLDVYGFNALLPHLAVMPCCSALLWLNPTLRSRYLPLLPTVRTGYYRFYVVDSALRAITRFATRLGFTHRGLVYSPYPACPVPDTVLRFAPPHRILVSGWTVSSYTPHAALPYGGAGCAAENTFHPAYCIRLVAITRLPFGSHVATGWVGPLFIYPLRMRLPAHLPTCRTPADLTFPVPFLPVGFPLVRSGRLPQTVITVLPFPTFLRIFPTVCAFTTRALVTLRYLLPVWP